MSTDTITLLAPGTHVEVRHRDELRFGTIVADGGMWDYSVRLVDTLYGHHGTIGIDQADVAMVITAERYAAAERYEWLAAAIESENLYRSESLAQYRSEVALYGDAGPGQHPSLFGHDPVPAWRTELDALNERWDFCPASSWARQDVEQACIDAF